uniref:Large ribosomal subunit protein eL28 n=1 Tax=Suberites domuncula TaxID=55567 RepID=Q4KTF6_SUBDO|nr:L28 [Suberites domuncula]
MSAELQWELIKNSSSFLLRRKGPRGSGVTFTTEPNNVMNKNSFKFNGLVNKKVVGVSSAADNKGVLFKTKRSKVVSKPAKMFVRATLSKDRRRAFKSIKKNLECTEYRPDLAELAVRRASAILSSQRPAKRLKGKK